jgi:predicted O-methyltransferase YrrM
MNKVVTIRPHEIFASLENHSSNTFIKMVVPSINNGIGYGSPNFLETICILSLLKLKNPEYIFEFGTFTGQFATQFAANIPDAKVFTLDIPKSELASLSSPEVHNEHSRVEDNNLREISTDIGGIIIDRAKSEPYHANITRMLHNSTTVDTLAMGLNKFFDFIFIDGGHDYNTIKSDTQKAYEMSRDNALIVWHDYTSPTHTDVKRFIDEISMTQTIYHIGDTTVAFSWTGFPTQIRT